VAKYARFWIAAVFFRYFHGKLLDSIYLLFYDKKDLTNGTAASILAP